jgi:hypothetical protein
MSSTTQEQDKTVVELMILYTQDKNRIKTITTLRLFSSLESSLYFVYDKNVFSKTIIHVIDFNKYWL